MGLLLLALPALQPTAPEAAPSSSGARSFQPEGWSATALVTVRQRPNRNAVRISAAGQDWGDVGRVVRLTHRLELLVVLDAGDAAPAIRDNPNVILLRRRGVREVAPRYSDPGDASRLLFDKLKSFDDRGISWLEKSAK